MRWRTRFAKRGGIPIKKVGMVLHRATLTSARPKEVVVAHWLSGGGFYVCDEVPTADGWQYKCWNEYQPLKGAELWPL